MAGCLLHALCFYRFLLFVQKSCTTLVICELLHIFCHYHKLYWTIQMGVCMLHALICVV